MKRFFRGILFLSCCLLLLCSCAPAAQTTVDAETIADLEKQIEELTKENEALRNQPQATAAPTPDPTPVPKPEPLENALYTDEYISIRFEKIVDNKMRLTLLNRSDEDISVNCENLHDWSAGEPQAQVNGTERECWIQFPNIRAGGTVTGYLWLQEEIDEFTYDILPLTADTGSIIFSGLYLDDMFTEQLLHVTEPITFDPSQPQTMPISLPDFSGETLFGEPIDFSYFSANKVTMVNYWLYLGGDYDLQQIREYSELARTYADQGFGALCALNTDGDTWLLDEAKAFWEEAAISYPLVMRQGALEDVFSNDKNYADYVLFFDNAGNQIGDAKYYWSSESECEQYIKSLLEPAE